MSPIFQFIVPLLTALLVLGVFHLVAYLHLQLAEADVDDSGAESGTGSGLRLSRPFVFPAPCFLARRGFGMLKRQYARN